MPKSSNEVKIKRPVDAEFVRNILSKGVMSGAEVLAIRCRQNPGFIARDLFAREYDEAEILDLVKSINESRATAYFFRYPNPVSP